MMIMLISVIVMRKMECLPHWECSRVHRYKTGFACTCLRLKLEGLVCDFLDATQFGVGRE